jgi:hypothetical protein
MTLRVGLASAVAQGPRNSVCVANRKGSNKAFVGGGVGAAVANTLARRNFAKLTQGCCHLHHRLKLFCVARDEGGTH